MPIDVSQPALKEIAGLGAQNRYQTDKESARPQTRIGRSDVARGAPAFEMTCNIFLVEHATSVLPGYAWARQGSLGKTEIGSGPPPGGCFVLERGISWSLAASVLEGMSGGANAVVRIWHLAARSWQSGIVRPTDTATL